MMSEADTGDAGGVRRRLFVKGGMVWVGSEPVAFLSQGGTSATALTTAARDGSATRIAASASLPVPPVIRSHQDLIDRGASVPKPTVAPTPLPIRSGGTTYQMAQSLAWLDSRHFAVGRWDGSMSIFEFTTTRTTGPVISKSVNSPSFQGVRMLTPLAGGLLVSSNDGGSVALWSSPGQGWSNLRPARTISYDRALGVATSGCAVRTARSEAGTAETLVIGHQTGHLSVWDCRPERHDLVFLRSVDLRNPRPVNPWGLHDINAIDIATADSGTAVRVVTGSEDGCLCVVDVPSGRIVSRTVFNPKARRGINDLGVRGAQLLVANCSVGPEDFNLWSYEISDSDGGITLRDRLNLIVDTTRPQVFNFNTVWGSYEKGPCWFASTEEGTLWMGTADSDLKVIGYQQVTSPLGSALGWTDNPGRLAMAAYDLYEFTT